MSSTVEQSGEAEAGDSIGARSAAGVAWLSGGALVGAVLQVAYTAAISRLLDPTDFGVLAAAALLIRLVEVLSRAGIQNAVVQRKVLTDQQINLAFTYSLAIGAASFGAIVLASPLVRLIVDQPSAPAVTRAVGATALIGGVGAVAEGLLRRRFDFRRLAAIGVTAQLLGFSAGIGAALWGLGVWSLAVAAVVQGVTTASLMVLIAGHRPRYAPRSPEGTELLRFGVSSSVIGYLEFIGSSLDTISVGRWAGTAALGQYTRATMLVQLPASQAANVVGKVLLTSMSSVQDDRPRFRRLYLMTVAIYAAALAAIALSISVAAPAVVRVLLGPGWEETIAVLPLVAAGSALTLGAQPLGTAAEAVGALRAKLAITMLQVAVGIGGVVVVVQSDGGLQEFATVWVASEFIRWLAYQAFARTVLDIPVKDLARPYVEALGLAVVFSSPLFLFTRVLELPDLVALLGGGIAAVVLTGLTWLAVRSRLFLNETVNAVVALRSS